jgi:hypothetical protein
VGSGPVASSLSSPYRLVLTRPSEEVLRHRSRSFARVAPASRGLATVKSQVCNSCLSPGAVPVASDRASITSSVLRPACATRTRCRLTNITEMKVEGKARPLRAGQPGWALRDSGRRMSRPG